LIFLALFFVPLIFSADKNGVTGAPGLAVAAKSSDGGDDSPATYFTARRDGYYGLFVNEGGETRELFFSGELLKKRPNMARYHITYDVSDDGTRVAFSAMSVSGNMDIFLLDREEGNTRNLTRSANVDTQPVFNGDATRIAYLSHEPGGRRYDNIYLVTINGKIQRRLTSHFARVFSLSFSPDDRHILMTRSFSANSIVSLLNIETGRVRDLTPRSCSSKHPAFNDDGTSIVFASDCRGSYDIWTANVQGRSRRLLFEGPREEYAPHFSHDGNRVVFLSETGTGDTGGYNSLLSIGLEHNDRVDILAPRQRRIGLFYSHLGVSRSSNHIFFQIRSRTVGGGSKTEVFTMDMKTRHPREIYARRGTLSSQVVFR
jgi:Tol biopolymer transport system component